MLVTDCFDAVDDVEDLGEVFTGVPRLKLDFVIAGGSWCAVLWDSSSEMVWSKVVGRFLQVISYSHSKHNDDDERRTIVPVSNPLEANTPRSLHPVHERL